MSETGHPHAQPSVPPLIRSTTAARPQIGTTLRWILGAGGVALLILGIVLLAFWEVTLFRITAFDRDFTGATCGTPLDNPGWTTGSPCHGAVNRQTGAAWVLTMIGLASTCVALVATAHAKPDAKDATAAH